MEPSGTFPVVEFFLNFSLAVIKYFCRPLFNNNCTSISDYNLFPVSEFSSVLASRLQVMLGFYNEIHSR